MMQRIFIIEGEIFCVIDFQKLFFVFSFCSSIAFGQFGFY
jgi:hypothetical protein